MAAKIVSVPPPNPRPPRRYEVTCYCGAELECDETDFEYIEGVRSSAYIDCPRCLQSIAAGWLRPLDAADSSVGSDLLVLAMCVGGGVLRALLFWLFGFLS